MSQFYPSIYTHVLDWAIRGKTVAKAKRAASGLGPLLDRHTRDGQDRQSIGIPIGPDTSLVLAELVLARVDEDVAASGGGLHGFRYYDDYELYTASRAQADRAISRLTTALANWQLILNPHKVSVEELPVPVEDEWVSALKRIRIGDHPSSQRSGFTDLFDEATRMARRFPRDAVLAYALGVVITRDGELRHRPQRQNWSYLQDLLLQAALGEPGLLPRIGMLVQWARLQGWPVPQKSLEPALNLLVREAARRGHASEVAWGTWIAVRLQVPLRATTAAAIASLVDDVVAIVALDARDQGIIRSIDVSNWAPLMSRESLAGDHWLLAYEAHVHGWLPSADGSDYIAADPPFAHLRRNQVRFYDERVAIPIPVMRVGAARVATSVKYVAGSGADEEPPEPTVYEG